MIQCHLIFEMRYTLAVIFSELLFCVLGSVSNQFPYETGPYAVRQASYGSIFNSELDHYLKVWAPDAPGEFPLVYHFTGLAGLGVYVINGNVVFQIVL